MAPQTRFTLAQTLLIGGAAVLALAVVSSRRPEGATRVPVAREIRASTRAASPTPPPARSSIPGSSPRARFSAST